MHVLYVPMNRLVPNIWRFMNFSNNNNVIIIIFGNNTCETRLCETKRRSQNIVMTVFCAMTAFYFCGQINRERSLKYP